MKQTEAKGDLKINMNNKTKQHEKETTIKCIAFAVSFVVIFVLFTGCQHNEFTHEVKTAKKPWSHEKFYNNPEDFQFVIVSDRTGRPRSGVFPLAAKKLNLLRPEFVISVGDLIQGAPRDKKSLLRQWKQFNEFVKCFDMPFFYVPGNHDITNKKMALLWDEFFGQSYYYFIYKDVLFMCLNSQDTPDNIYKSSSPNLSDTQINWAKKVLKKHPKVRWTYVFMHQPLWLYSEDFIKSGKKHPAKVTGFKDVEKALSNRNYSVFAGHFHQYTKYIRNNQKYFIFSTTGGRNKLRGPKFGEFDHGVWVTATAKGPIIANLLTDGILDENIVTEKMRKKMDKKLYFPNSIKFLPEKKKDGFSMLLNNPFEHPLKYELLWESNSWVLFSDKTSGILSPGKSLKLFFAVKKNGKTPYSIPVCKAKFYAENELDCKYSLPAKIVRQLFPPEIQAVPITFPPVIDGKLNDAIWKGVKSYNKFMTHPKAGKVSVNTEAFIAYDKNNLYIAVKCFESDLGSIKAAVKKHDGAIYTDDSIDIFLDTNKDKKTYFQLAINSRGISCDGYIRDKSFELNPIIATSKDKKSWMVEVAIPWKNLNVEKPKPETVWGVAFARTRTKNKEVQQLPPLFGKNHQPKMFANLKFKDLNYKNN